MSADVADRAELARALDEARRRFGVIHGVVHAAGIAGGGIIQLKTPETADRVLEAKVQGTLALWDLLAGEDLDVLFLCSSITAVTGGPGQVDYCGANAFLDAFARSRGSAASGPRVVSVKWDRGLRWAGGNHGGAAPAPRARDPPKHPPAEGVEVSIA